MKRFLLSALTLTLALQPVFASAYTIKGVERMSRRSIIAAHAQQEQNRLATKTGMVKPATVITPTTYAPVGDYTPTLPATGYAVGQSSAQVTVVEFVDYACAFCAEFAQKTFPTIKTAYVDTGKVRFVFRNFPISYHAAAGVAAEAVECSRQQSEDYAMQLQSKLFAITAKGNDLTQDAVYTAFQSLAGIDTEKMYYCIDTAATQGLITTDMNDAAKGGVNGVPSFWVLGKKGKSELVQGTLDSAQFKKVLDNMLK